MYENEGGIGLDLSPAHFAMVRLDAFGQFKAAAMAGKPALRKAWAKATLPNVAVYTITDTGLHRLRSLRNAVTAAWAIIGGDPGVRIAMEDYALNVGSKGRVFETGESSGVARLELLDNGASMRFWAPTSVKLGATGYGGADKNPVRASMIEFGAPVLPNNCDPDGDFYDAYALARLCWLETEIRAGRMTSADCSAGERMAFHFGDPQKSVLTNPYTRFIL